MSTSSLRQIITVATIALVSIFVFAACFGQHDPTPDWKKQDKERLNAHKPIAALTATGEIPSADAEQGPSIAEKYTTFCSSCHGANGGGDGPAGGALNPKPRNFHDAAWQARVNDEHIFQAIKGGGASVGLSPMMAPWGGVLNDAEIKEMVQHVRSFKQG